MVKKWWSEKRSLKRMRDALKADTETRVKISSQDMKMIEKIMDMLENEFFCIPGPIYESDGVGHYVFVEVEWRDE